MSKYAQTLEGQQAIEKLERLHARGRIVVIERSPDDDPNSEIQRADALYDRDNDKIEIMVDEGQELDPERAASSLLHEAQHGVIHDERRRGGFDPPQHVNEGYGWGEELKFYREQQEQGSEVHDDKVEEYAEDPAAFLRKYYG